MPNPLSQLHKLKVLNAHIGIADKDPHLSTRKLIGSIVERPPIADLMYLSIFKNLIESWVRPNMSLACCADHL